MKLTTGKNNHYQIQMEPGDTVTIVFDPRGVNVPLEGSMPVTGMTVSTILPKFSFLALGVAFDKEVHYKGEYNERGEFDVLCQSEADKMEFDISLGEMPREVLHLKRVRTDND